MRLEYEKVIIEKSKKNSHEFGLLYKEYFKDVYRYAYAVLHDKENTEEVVQKTFILGLEKIQDFVSKDVSIKYWFLRIARNLLYASYVKRELILDSDKIDAITEENDNCPDPVEIGMQKDISDALMQLPGTTREIIVLKIWQEYTFEEISNLVDMEHSAVKMQFYRGISKLRDILQKKGYDKSYIVFPVLFKGILESQNLEIYDPAADLLGRIGKIMQTSINMSTQTLSNLNKFKILSNMNSKILGYIGAGVLSATSVAGLTYVVTTQVVQKESCPPAIAQTVNSNTPTNGLQSTAEVTAKPGDNQVTTNIVNPKGYTYVFNGRSKNIPAGWYVSSTNIEVKDLTWEEKSEMIKPAYDEYYGIFPIHRSTELIISNGVSNVRYYSENGVTRSPWGITPSCLDSGYTVVKEPTSVEGGGGLARAKKSDDTYDYLLVTFALDGDTCKYNAYTDAYYKTTYTFSGSDGDLSTADEIVYDLMH